ncbi:MFS transporter [Deinococcus sp.]|uniref:MFS transporter n=1 Tax=Deinococcus sp. TaxID=47478 RepID=UPI0025CE39F8|nr:MFS transporter [Deinococcus sp.]
MSTWRRPTALLTGVYRRFPGGFWVLWTGTLINRSGEFVVPLLGFYLSQRGFTVTQVTLVLSVLGVGRFFAEPLGGALTDARGPRLTMLLALFGGALALLALGNAGTYLWTVAGVLSFSLLSSLYKPAASTAVAELTSGPLRAQAYNLLYWAINVGASLAPLLGGVLAAVSYRLLFMLDAATMAVYGALIAWRFRLPRRVRLAGPTPRTPSRLPRDPLLWSMMLAALLFATTYQSYRLLALVFAAQGYSPVQYGQALALNGVLVVVLGLPLGHWVGRGNRPRAQAVGALLLGLGFALHGFAHSLGVHLLAIGIWTLGEIVSYSIGKSVVAELGRREVRGRYIGLMGSMSGLGTFTGPLLGGWVLSSAGNTALWLMYAALAGLAAALYWLLESAVLDRRALRVAEEQQESGLAAAGD